CSGAPVVRVTPEPPKPVNASSPPSIDDVTSVLPALGAKVTSTNVRLLVALRLPRSRVSPGCVPPMIGPVYAQAFARQSARSGTVGLGLSGRVTHVGESKALEVPI